ncbi:aspartate carbamoyltransferase regulatory subunit [Candidatus Woesearchaeota archaeon]|nr:aspartate carbamoyltransferase regulatory subunit [Candidatus Woesearchaeota archaeon]
MKAKLQTLEVSAIEHGTVLDHLPSEKVMKIAGMLGFHTDCCVTIGLNLTSKKHQKKGIIKIAGRDLEEAELNKIAILAPHVTVNTIEGFLVTKKKKIVLRGIEPDTIRCMNPNCITNHQSVITKFHIIEKTPLKIRCYYCERSMEEKEIEFL